MTFRHLIQALLLLMVWPAVASAQELSIGATYHCTAPVPDFILESCAGEYCHIQSLNPAAPDGRGAALDLYRSMLPDRMRGCTPTGGTPATGPSAAPAQPSAAARTPSAPARRQAPPNPAYIAGAGAGVRFNPPGAPAAAVRLVATSYYCTAFIGTPPNGRLATMPGFAILPGGRYRHQDGSTGTVTTAGGTLLFHGGALDGRAATYDAGASGRGTVHLYNDSRSRTVIDCDGQR